jgi:2-keto-4-pentenoate hydratase/2-oxohepta-3-ene-1,7-dioic acid hydratase in catechol pathway
MKLLSFRHGNRESWGAVVNDGVIDLGSKTKYPTLAAFIASDDFHAHDRLLVGATPDIRLQEISFLPTIPQPEKIVCAVRNYMDHHKEALAAGLQRELSDFPPIFLRVWRSQIGHLQPMVRPRVSESLDWECELAVVIGKAGRDISEERAFDHVAGYSAYNDGSIREWQFHAKQIASGKNFEGTGPFGPWMVTKDEITDNRGLNIETRINGETMQSGNTGQMIFPTARLIAYASTIFTLVPGDVIITGTPSGVGFSRKPPRFLKPGDTIEVEIEAIGILKNPVIEQPE